jgi:drug/metabolite transporter (DMT)-like permease
MGIVYALLFGYFLFGEVYAAAAYVGMGVVITGVILNIWYKHTLVATLEK